ncbi:short-chain dehydrogenase [Thiomicrorhabdus immobilis]|uniref:Short-chain dehydrogenase n=1 Tax=Thiomicrorhabdus immobilis TaxID=2791037 RepID=A0ABM7MEP7_9GAMM|nr:SDR family oxidoreductase [Thiomicrorhabdus immobilis]BCN93922.1 short-chain dehydrogenase [Thiomicrorhabdus immobilis]
MQKNILIIGATSAIAKATLRMYAEQNHNLFLVARNEALLHTIAEDAKIRGAHQVEYQACDLADLHSHPSLLETITATYPKLDIVLIAHGTLPNQQACQASVETTLQEININALSTISLLTLLANQFEKQQDGTIAVITSVAGDRGRQSNYVYGAAKGMVSTFLQGLRNRLNDSNVQVLDIKPGFVDTPMTADFKKGALWAQPEQIAKSILKAIDNQRNTLYTPWFWWGIMLIIRTIPECIFKKLKL